MQARKLIASVTLVVVVVGLAVWLGIGVMTSTKNEPGNDDNYMFYPEDVERFDCHPDRNSTQSECIRRGCIWAEPAAEPNAPWCFYSAKYGYRMVGEPVYDTSGILVNLERLKTPERYGHAAQSLRLEIQYRGNSGIHFKVRDPSTQRYEVPMDTTNVHTHSDLYDVSFRKDPFGLKITRLGTSTVLFDTTVGGLTFEDQFLQISTRLPSSNIYGFGEHLHRRFRHDLEWKTWGMFTHDVPPVGEWNLYGHHPFYMCVEDGGDTHGVFLLNSNAMEVALQPAPALTYRTIGGVLDFYLFVGPTPEKVIQQYFEVIGNPVMVPYWMLGYQLCRWGYDSLDRVKEVWSEMVDAGIPYDVQYGDIDYMDEKKDFTYDPVNYAGLPEFVDTLHDHGQKYIIILDPGIKVEEGYSAYERGIDQDVFIQTANGSGPIIGRVWPGNCAFPDYTSPNTQQWWTDLCAEFREEVKYDALWIDMNEPSNFVSGSIERCDENEYNNPPYLPDILAWNRRPYARTLCMDSPQALGLHYDVHSLYGHSMSQVTHRTLETVFPDKRSMAITRSTFPGTGRYAQHWLGDNESRWDNIWWSIVAMFEFNMFGFPFVGADICGFLFNTQYELCWRWTQIGAFYPFSRNHNADGWEPQHPTAFDEAFANMTRDILMERYRLLPYLYTLFDDAHRIGTTVVRPLLFEFPSDPLTYDLDRQFLWGSALMISPVLEEGKISVEVYFPDTRWFDYYTGEEMTSQRGQLTILRAPLDVINIHVRGGYILPLQVPSNTTAYSRLNPLGLLVALDDNHRAEGSLYWDNGETRDEQDYTRLRFVAENGVITSRFDNLFYSDPNQLYFEHVIVYGVDDYDDERGVFVNEQRLTDGVTFDKDLKVLAIRGLALDMMSIWTLRWTLV